MAIEGDRQREGCEKEDTARLTVCDSIQEAAGETSLPLFRDVWKIPAGIARFQRQVSTINGRLFSDLDRYHCHDRGINYESSNDNHSVILLRKSLDRIIPCLNNL